HRAAHLAEPEQHRGGCRRDGASARRTPAQGCHAPGRARGAKLRSLHLVLDPLPRPPDRASVMRGRVIGLGRVAAADDGVGPARVRALRPRWPGPSGGLFVVAGASAVIELLDGDGDVVIVDAVVCAAEEGALVELDAAAIGRSVSRPASTHGIDLTLAIAL